MSRLLSIATSATSEFGAPELSELHAMIRSSFGGGYDQAAWKNCLGGTHFVMRLRGSLIGHVSVVPRLITIAGIPFHAAYMESATVVPEHRGQLFGTSLVAAASAYIIEEYTLGALATSHTPFYERLRWKTWSGRSFVLKDGIAQPSSPHGRVMVLPVDGADVDTADEIFAPWREGAIW